MSFRPVERALSERDTSMQVRVRTEECPSQETSMSARERTSRVEVRTYTPEALGRERSGAPEMCRPRAVLLGLPCGHCGAYYDADLCACPICSFKERVSPGGPGPTIQEVRISA
jgi:hypothetical protein